MSASELVSLGESLSLWLEGKSQWPELDSAVDLASQENPWFTPFMQKRSISDICSQFLSAEKLLPWIAQYPFAEQKRNRGHRCGIVMAGNIPLVGFQDLLCVLLSGWHPVVKMSSKDRRLFPVLFPKLEYVEEISPSEVDALITMGGNSAAAYFGSRFSGVPTLIRASRFSLAVLTGKETPSELRALSEDVLLYYGFGCRNVSVLLLPSGYDFTPLSVAVSKTVDAYENGLLHRHYLKNRAEMTIDGLPFTDTGNFLFFPLSGGGHNVPPASLGYTFYKSDSEINAFLLKNKDNIQKKISIFGFAQSPELNDYPDGKDTMSFLENAL